MSKEDQYAIIRELCNAVSHFEAQIYPNRSAMSLPYEPEARILHALYSNIVSRQYGKDGVGRDVKSEFKVIDAISALMLLVKLEAMPKNGGFVEQIYNIHLKSQETFGAKICTMSEIDLQKIINSDFSCFLKDQLNGYVFINRFFALPKEIPHTSYILEVLNGRLSMEGGLELINKEKAEAQARAEAEATEAARIAEEVEAARAEVQAAEEAARAEAEATEAARIAEEELEAEAAGAQPEEVLIAGNGDAHNQEEHNIQGNVAWYADLWCNVM
jgi:outer membrane murein-binding lipoprotein Lpp